MERSFDRRGGGLWFTWRCTTLPGSGDNAPGSPRAWQLPPCLPSIPCCRRSLVESLHLWIRCLRWSCSIDPFVDAYGFARMVHHQHLPICNVPLPQAASEHATHDTCPSAPALVCPMGLGAGAYTHPWSVDWLTEKPQENAPPANIPTHAVRTCRAGAAEWSMAVHALLWARGAVVVRTLRAQQSGSCLWLATAPAQPPAQLGDWHLLYLALSAPLAGLLCWPLMPCPPCNLWDAHARFAPATHGVLAFCRAGRQACGWRHLSTSSR
jgi:hypothetical protein